MYHIGLLENTVCFLTAGFAWFLCGPSWSFANPDGKLTWLAVWIKLVKANISPWTSKKQLFQLKKLCFFFSRMKKRNQNKKISKQVSKHFLVHHFLRESRSRKAQLEESPYGSTGSTITDNSRQTHRHNKAATDEKPNTKDILRHSLKQTQ